jgi:F-type H+-transporting ATPase subunit gamma
MISLRALREEQFKVAELGSIVSSLQIVSITQMRQFMYKKQNYNKVVQAIEQVISQVSHEIKIEYIRKPLHLVLSCDQKFCRKLMNMLEKHISSLELASDSQIMLFGSRSKKFLKKLLPDAEVREYRALMNIEECERIAFELRKKPQLTYLHYYDEIKQNYSSLQLLPILASTGKEEVINLGKYDLDSLLQLFLVSKIYYASLTTGLKERSDRALTMSEASENAEKSARELRIMYNKIRQAMVTKEIVASD